MQNITKKFIVSIVTIAFAFTIAAPASAATVEELQAQIAALLAQIQTLQAQLGTVQTGTTGTGTGACAGISFTRTLKLGMSGTDVKCMQTILNQSADTQVSVSGSGSPGYETTYFGAKTKAAVVVFQQKYASEVLTPIGLTAGTGLVGAKTVAKLNTLIGATGGTGGTGTVTPTLPTASGLTVTVAADNAVSGTIISDGGTNVAGSQALIPFLKLNFSTPAGTSAKVTTLKLQRLGVCSDSDITNAYLFDGNTKVAEMTSLSLGVMTFVNPAGLFTVSGFKTLTVKGDLYNDASAGKTIGLGVVSAASIVTDASAVNGTFPINGNLMTTAVVTDFGRLQVATTTNSATVDPGATGWEAARINLTAGSQKIKLYSIKFLQLGSIQKADIANLALYTGATQLGTTQATMASDGTVTFDLSSAPLEIAAGLTKTLALRVDVIGGSTRSIQFSLQRSSDIVAVDSNYGVSVNPDTGTIGTYSVLISTAASVTSGNLTISKSIDSPSGNVARSSTNVTLAKFDVKAVGEDIKLSTLIFKIASTSASVWSKINNAKIFYDGYQVGALVNLTAGGNETIYPNITIPVGQTKVISVVADISQSSSSTDLGSGSKITAYLETGASNAQRMTSLGAFGFPSAENAGNELTVSAAALSVAKNYSVGDISTVYNVQGITIGSWNLTAGSAEGIDISRIEVTDASTSVSTSTAQNSLGKAFTNLKMYYGSTQLGSTVVPGSADLAQTKYSFYPSSFSLVAGQTVRLDLKADVLSSNLTWTNTNASQISAVDGTGKITTNAANVTGPHGVAAGQGITLNAAGILTGALDSSSPEASMVAMGDTAKTLGIWKLTANSVEDLTVSQIVVTNRAVATSSSNVGTMTLYCGDAQFGSSQGSLIYSAALYGGTYYAAFSSSAGTCVIPKGSSKTITLKGDITSYGAGATSGQYLQFALSVPYPINGNSTNDIIARGAGGYASTTARSTSTANPVYTYRTSLTSSLACNGACTSRTRSATDKIASLTLTGTALVDGLFRAGLTDVNDDAIANASTNQNGNLAGQVGSYASDTCFYASNTALDGGLSIAYVASTSVATTTYVLIYTGDLNSYSKLSLWLYPHGSGTARTVFTAATNTGNAYIQRIASTTTGTLTIGKWNRVELNLVASTSAPTYVGVAFPDQDASGGNFYSSHLTRILVDAVKAYNDSITVTFGGNASSSGNGQPIYLKTTGNQTKAADYFDSINSTVELVPSAEIAVGSTPQTFDLISDTTTLIDIGQSGISRTLSMSISLGSVSTAGVITAGGFRWYDQAVVATSPITWMGGATPISVTISLGSGI